MISVLLGIYFYTLNSFIDIGFENGLNLFDDEPLDLGGGLDLDF